MRNSNDDDDDNEIPENKGLLNKSHVDAGNDIVVAVTNLLKSDSCCCCVCMNCVFCNAKNFDDTPPWEKRNGEFGVDDNQHAKFSEFHLLKLMKNWK